MSASISDSQPESPFQEGEEVNSISYIYGIKREVWSMDVFRKIEKQLDWKKVKVIGGDLEAGAWDFAGDSIVLNPFTTVVLQSNIKDLKVQTEQSMKDLPKTVGMTLAGSLFGPLGAMAGFIAAGHKKEICLLCELKDGRKFLAIMDNRVYQQFLALSL